MDRMIFAVIQPLLFIMNFSLKKPSIHRQNKALKPY